jgi:hypothetical protein
MAKKSRNKSSAELRDEVARSREQLACRVDRVRDEIDLPRKIRRSVRREPVPWIVGAIAIGLLLTVIATRKKKIYVDPKISGSHKPAGKLLEAGFVLGVLRIAATLLKPVVVKLVREKFASFSAPPRPLKRF